MLTGSSLRVRQRGQAPLLFGRTRELGLLREQLTAALAGEGRLVLIAGEAGIGKTTLAEALGHEAAARGALVLTGPCYELTETPPYGPWLELAGRYPAPGEDLPSLPPVLARRGTVTATASQEALFAEVLGFLAAVADRRPLVLILEDLHWSDPASLDLLRCLGREATRLSLLVVATYRSEEMAGQHPLYTMLPMLVREARAIRIELQPLATTDIHALVRARYTLAVGDRDRLVTYLQARAQGNPFFLGELLRALEDNRVLRPVTPRGGRPVSGKRWELGDLTEVGLPVLLRQVLDRHLARLAGDDRGLLGVAATIGQEVPLALWAAVGLVEEDTLLSVVERGVEARVLVAPADGESVRFTHALVREALYEGLLPPRRRVWHRRVAEALVALPSPDPDAVAYHFRLAGDVRAGEWLVRAGERAQRAYAWLTAAERYEAALAPLGKDSAAVRERARLLLIVAQLRRYTAAAQGIAQLEEAERLAEVVGDQALAASARFDRGHLRCMVRDFERGLAEMHAGLAALEALTPSERVQLPSLTVLGVPHWKREHYHRGVLVLFLAVLGHLAEAEAIGTSPGGDGRGMTARELLGWSWLYAARGEPDRARRALTAARAAYGDQHYEVGTTLYFELDLVVLPYETDRLAERRRLAVDAEHEWTRSSGALAGFPPRFARLPLLLLEGRWAKARDVALTVLATAESNDAWRRYPSHYLGPLALAQGDLDVAWQLVREEFPAGPATPPGATWFLPALALQRLAAALALNSDDLATARAWLVAHDDWLAWSGATLGRAAGELGWAAYYRAAGDRTLARRHAMQALAHAGAPRQPLALLAAHRLLGELATAAGDYVEAAMHLDAALVLADACAAPYERALTLLSLAELRRAARDREAVESLLAEARAICAQLGARRALARADALAIKRVPELPGGYPAGLTTREAEVLTLIACGRSNGEIAEELVLSVRTVERHINNLYRKIDARGRADATAFAARHGLLPHPGPMTHAPRSRF